MKIISLSDKHYSAWDDFCKDSDDAWFRHTTTWMQYTLNHSPELSSESKSFFIADGNRILAILPLIIEQKSGIRGKSKELSFGGSFGISPAISNELSARKRHVMKQKIFEHVDQIALENNVQRMSIRCPVLSANFHKSSFPTPNWLLRYGFIDVSLHSQLLDLSQDISVLWQGMRRDLRKNISRDETQLEFEVLDKNNVNTSVFGKYRELHHLASGRVTRPLSTFDLMYEWIQNGHAVLFGAKCFGEFVGFFFVTVYKNGAYNGSSCRHPDYSHLSIGHYLRWEIAKWLKSNNIIYYEIGIQQFGNLPYDLPSVKEINISNAKRGLGGHIVPLYRGEKYYSQKYYHRIMQNRMERYSATLSDPNVKVKD